MSQPNSVVDAPAGQTLVFGSQKVTFSIAGQLIVEEFRVKYGMRELDSNDEVGKPNKAAYIPTKGRGTCVAQPLASTTAAPTRGETFTAVPVGGGSARNFIVISEPMDFDNSGTTKFSMDVVEKLN